MSYINLPIINNLLNTTNISFTETSDVQKIEQEVMGIVRVTRNRKG